MKMTETNLRRLIRETLLAEAAYTPADAKSRGITFTVKDRKPDYVEIKAYFTSNGYFAGFLSCHKEDDPCEGAWAIDGSEAREKGLGPLMYDLMIDLVSPDPLASDRVEVSQDARNVWNYYRDRRPDIDQLDLDDVSAPRTPRKEDDCEQSSARIWADDTYGDEQRWPESSLSKAYKRADGQTPTLDALTGIKLIRFI